MKRMTWLEIVGIAAVGGVGAYTYKYYTHKLRVGDIALVPVSSLQLTLPSQAGNVSLSQFAGSGIARVVVTDTSSSNSIKGNVDTSSRPVPPGVTIPVAFSESSSQGTERAGKLV